MTYVNNEQEGIKVTEGTDLEELLGMAGQIDAERRQRVASAMKSGDRAAAVAEILEARLGKYPSCPHCKVEGARPWGRNDGLRRWRCVSCSRTFNAITGTPLARLRKKECRLSFATCLSKNDTVQKSAETCKVSADTSFRWQHRFR